MDTNLNYGVMLKVGQKEDEEEEKKKNNNLSFRLFTYIVHFNIYRISCVTKKMLLYLALYTWNIF